MAGNGAATAASMARDGVRFVAPLALINPMLGGKYVVMCVREATHSRAIGYRFIGLTARYTFSLPLSASLNGGKS